MKTGTLVKINLFLAGVTVIGYVEKYSSQLEAQQKNTQPPTCQRNECKDILKDHEIRSGHIDDLAKGRIHLKPFYLPVRPVSIDAVQIFQKLTEGDLSFFKKRISNSLLKKLTGFSKEEMAAVVEAYLQKYQKQIAKERHNVINQLNEAQGKLESMQIVQWKNKPYLIIKWKQQGFSTMAFLLNTSGPNWKIMDIVRLTPQGFEAFPIKAKMIKQMHRAVRKARAKVLGS